MSTQIPAVHQVERYVHQRRDTDRPLIGWGVYFFLLSWVTLGIYSVVVFYQRLARADAFRARKRAYYGAVLDFTKQFAEASGDLAAVHDGISDVEGYVKHRFSNEHREINPGLTLLLSLVTLGIYGFVGIAHAMRFWWEAQVTEQEFDDKVSQLWEKLGVVKYPVTFEPVQGVRRSFWGHFGLALATIGIYVIVWDHQLHTDPDRVYPEFHAAEDTVLSAVRAAIPHGHVPA